jgi:anti-anti-sigma regulatory factor/putative methionine-R-sulfoxide reductase with GAF domain
VADKTTQTTLDHLQDQLRAVQAINDTLRTSPTLAAVYPVVTEKLAGAIRFDSMWIGVYEAENDVIRFEYGVDDGVIDDQISRRPLNDSPLSARVIRARQLQLIDDLLADPIQQQIHRFGQNERPSRAWMGAPMISGGEVQGLLAVMSYQPGVFVQADTEMLTLVTSQMALAIANIRLVERLRQTIVRISAPLIPVAEGVLVLPLIGQIDGERANQIVEQTLGAVVGRQAEHVLIDITGVDTVDMFTISQLLKIVRTTALLGAHCYLVGMSPEAAQAATSLGVDLGMLQSYRDMQSALADLLRGRDAAHVTKRGRSMA